MFVWRADILKGKGWVTSDRKYLKLTVYRKGLGFGSFLYHSVFQNLGSICTMEAFSH